MTAALRRAAAQLSTALEQLCLDTVTRGPAACSRAVTQRRAPSARWLFAAQGARAHLAGLRALGRAWANPAGSRLALGCDGRPLQGSLWQARGMFIQTQDTPNEHSLMFLPGRPVVEKGSYDFPDARSAMASPLAKKLFLIDGVRHVFFGSDFITVSKDEAAEWGIVKPEVFAAIMDHFSSGEPLVLEGAELQSQDTHISEDDSEVVAMIKELLDTRIRPAVQEDGGDIVFKRFNEETGVVSLKLVGACRGCSSSSVTLKAGVENMLKHYIPEVREVEEWLDASDEEGIKAFNALESHLSH